MPRPIPLLIALEFLKQSDDDRLEYLLRVGVVGAEYAMTADITVSPADLPGVTNVESTGGIHLPDDLETDFLLKCFTPILPSIEDSDIAHRPLTDATSWISAAFSPHAAEAISQELRKQVPDDLDFDPALASAFVPVGSRQKRGWHYVRH
jgi:hypothetical protein